MSYTSEISRELPGRIFSGRPESPNRIVHNESLPPCEWFRQCEGVPQKQTVAAAWEHSRLCRDRFPRLPARKGGMPMISRYQYYAPLFHPLHARDAIRQRNSMVIVIFPVLQEKHSAERWFPVPD